MAGYIGAFMNRVFRLGKSKRASEDREEEEKEEEEVEEDEDTITPTEEGGPEEVWEREGDGIEEEYKETMSFDEGEDDVFENDKERKVVDFCLL